MSHCVQESGLIRMKIINFSTNLRIASFLTSNFGHKALQPTCRVTADTIVANCVRGRPVGEQNSGQRIHASFDSLAISGCLRWTPRYSWTRVLSLLLRRMSAQPCVAEDLWVPMTNICIFLIWMNYAHVRKINLHRKQLLLLYNKLLWTAITAQSIILFTVDDRLDFLPWRTSPSTLMTVMPSALSKGLRIAPTVRSAKGARRTGLNAKRATNVLFRKL